VARDWRDDRIAEQDARIKRLEALVEALRRENAELKEKLGKSSRNSSKPPSSDSPADKAQRRSKEPTGRAPGGQPGHDKHERPEVPPEKVSKRVVLRPSQCAKCASRLVGDDPEPRRHQVFDLPKVEPVVTEYLLHALCCPDLLFQQP
jgi:transposase